MRSHLSCSITQGALSTRGTGPPDARIVCPHSRGDLSGNVLRVPAISGFFPAGNKNCACNRILPLPFEFYFHRFPWIVFFLEVDCRPNESVHRTKGTELVWRPEDRFFE